jgi:thiamine biosynthesis lipoprotein ApbE
MKKFVFCAISTCALLVCAVGSSACTPKENTTVEYSVPTAEAVETFRTLGEHFGEVELSQENGKYYATKPQGAYVEWQGKTYSMAIDLGGIGKGYAADVVKQKTIDAGFDYGYFVFGGSSLSFLNAVPQDDNGFTKNYNLTLTDPRGNTLLGTSYFSVTASMEGASTSGDYEQFVEKDGVRYCHIINPFTGRPIRTGVDSQTGTATYAAGICSATIVGGSAAEDDALTTALSVMSKEKAIAFINEKLTDRRVIFTYETDSGAMEIYTNIPQGEFTLTNQAYTVKGFGDGNGKIVEEAVKVATPAAETFEKPDYVSGPHGGYAVGTSYSYVLSIPANNSSATQTETAAREMFSWVDSYLASVEASLSVGIKTSAVYKFNVAAAGEKVEIDELCYNVLTLAKELYTMTEGYYNPAVYYSVDLFGFTPYSLLENS